MIESPDSVFRELGQMDSESMTQSVKAYYDLLYVISGVKSDHKFENDSIIELAQNYYETHINSYNLGRSYLYRAIILYDINPKNSMVVELLKLSEQQFNKNKRSNPYTYLVYHYLGLAHKLRSNYREAIKYLTKDLEHSITNRAQDRDIFNTLLNLFWVHVAKGDTIEAKEVLDRIETLNLPDSYNIYKYNINSTYYLLTEDYPTVLEYTLKLIPKVKSPSFRLLNSIALSYYYSGMIDSALVYVNRFDETDIKFRDNYEEMLHKQFLGKLYRSLGDYKRSSELFESSSDMLSMVKEDISINAIQDIEKRYELEEKELIIERMKLVNRLIILSISFSLLIAFLLVYIFWNRSGTHKKISLLQKEKIREVETIKGIIDATLGCFPGVFDDMYSLACKSDNYVYLEEMNTLIRDFKNENKKRLNEALSSESLITFMPELRSLPDFSANEKVILILSKLNCSTAYIAKVLNTSTSSLRGMKARVRTKIEASNLLLEEQKESLLSNFSSGKNIL